MTPIGWMILWLVSILITIILEIIVYRSSLSQDRKTALYIINIFMPIVGIVLFILFKKGQSNIPA